MFIVAFVTSVTIWAASRFTFAREVYKLYNNGRGGANRSCQALRVWMFGESCNGGLT